MNRIIFLEGLLGVGKTTLSKEIDARKINDIN